jgi:hypothetical protein
MEYAVERMWRQYLRIRNVLCLPFHDHHQTIAEIGKHPNAKSDTASFTQYVE